MYESKGLKKVLSVVGARPNFMKIAPIHRAFSSYSSKIMHKIVHTGQHYDSVMSDAVFADLQLPQPDFFMGASGGSHAEQTAKIMVEFEKICISEKPDLVLVVGDVNSTIACALSAVKLHIPVAHVEAGLRSRDRTMPEEINRMATDAISDWAFVTEQDAIENLHRENWTDDRIFFTGNVMIDSLKFAEQLANVSDIVHRLGLQPKEYGLVTMHRPSNVDDADSLTSLVKTLAECSEQCPIVFPIHPRTRKNISAFGLDHILNDAKQLLVIDPQSYIPFLSLTKNARFVLTDSGGVQEETTVFGVPCWTARTSTERPCTVSIGTNTMVEPSANGIRQALHAALTSPSKIGTIPPLWDGKAAERIVQIIAEIILKVT